MPSPIPWIADQLWDQWNPPNGLCLDGRAPIEEPQLEEVTEADLVRIPPSPVQGQVPPEGSLEEQLTRLLSTPQSAMATFSPVWPVCCKRLTTLVNSQGEGIQLEELNPTGPLEKSYLESQFKYTMQVSRTSREEFEAVLHKALDELRQTGFIDGLNVFECRVCGRKYLASCHP